MSGELHAAARALLRLGDDLTTEWDDSSARRFRATILAELSAAAGRLSAVETRVRRDIDHARRNL